MTMKKRTISITALALLLAVACGLFGSASAAASASGAPVDAAGAKQIALSHAGLTEAQIYTDHFIYFCDGKTTHAYKFVFHTDSNHYVYIISADTGAIKLSQCSGKGVDVSLATTNPPAASAESSTSDANTGSNNTSTSATSYIGADAAISAVLTKAGVTSADVYELEAKLESKNNVTYYKVEIKLFNGIKIKAQINASSGDFISFDTKDKNDIEWQPSGIITAERALQASLTQAGISASDLLKVEVELDDEHGTWIYEVELQTVSGAKYEYEINATTAAIIKIK